MREKHREGARIKALPGRLVYSGSHSDTSVWPRPRHRDLFAVDYDRFQEPDMSPIQRTHSFVQYKGRYEANKR